MSGVSWDPLIITVALTGNVPTKEMNPHVPVTSEEISEDVRQCYSAGATLFHVHSRDASQRPTQDLDVFRNTVRLIKEKTPDAIIQLSTGARAGRDPVERMNVVRLLPEMASFTTGSNNLAKAIYENSPAFLLQLAQVFHDTGVKPEIEVFDCGHLTNALFLAKKKKLLSLPLHFNFVLGTNGGMAGTVKNLQHMVDMVPEGCTWSVSGIGPSQMKLATAAIAMGGNVRVGLEDYIYMPDGRLATNVELVKTVVGIAKALGRPIATPSAAREILSLPREWKDRIVPYLDPERPLFSPDTTDDTDIPWSIDDVVPQLRESGRSTGLRSAGMSSQTLAANERAADLEKSGRKVFRAGFGQSPFPIPECVVEEARKHLERAQYTPVRGIPEFREAAAEFLNERYGMKSYSADRIIITPGSKQAIFNITQSLDADVVLCSPAWVSYYPQTVIARKKCHVIQTTKENEYVPTPEDIEKLCSSDECGRFTRKIIILNYPNNPTGGHISRKQAAALAPVLRKYNFIVISDEIYGLFSHTVEHVSLAMPEFCPERVVVTNGLSKTAGAGGWRVGFAALPEMLGFLMEPLCVLASNSYSCIPYAMQRAAMVALSMNPEITKYVKNCNRIMSALAQLSYEIFVEGEIATIRPTSGYYAMVDLGKYREPLRVEKECRSSSDVVFRVLQDVGISIISSEPFLLSSTDFKYRICLTDFDGAAALKACEEIPDGEPISEEFLRKYCSNVVLLAENLVRWCRGMTAVYE
eukprot:TRINITY_DN2924_c0_g1_i1.p1 TRINITY_DN2924_c0_g1~~TRINITY_DN2924_c0_g1_i1.p1  ORF type:complete len:754 (+),score=210.24 TRINITY_DN2924_c0_g1_i1:111-2372(+)